MRREWNLSGRTCESFKTACIWGGACVEVTAQRAGIPFLLHHGDPGDETQYQACP